jgi:hypothetical protein
MVVEAAGTCRCLVIYVIAYFTSLHLLVHYKSVNIFLMHVYGTYSVNIHYTTHNRME